MRPAQGGGTAPQCVTGGGGSVLWALEPLRFVTSRLVGAGQGPVVGHSQASRLSRGATSRALGPRKEVEPGTLASGG